MGAGQIGGIATLLDIDFKNAAGFIGTDTDNAEAQFIVYFLSHAMMFCVGTIIEAHVVLTPAGCVFGEHYKFEVFAGTHKFLEHSGTSRVVEHVCLHKGYNHSRRWVDCPTTNLALLVLSKQFSFHSREFGTDYVINRVRYGNLGILNDHRIGDPTCRYYGWGSRRNGYLIPLLMYLRRVDVVLLHPDKCPTFWSNNDNFLCIQQPQCKSEKYGALCPDDMGTVLVCSGYIEGIMISRLVDRPCGVGFLDVTKHHKFLTCGVDDARDVIDHSEYMSFDFTTQKSAPTVAIKTPPMLNQTMHGVDEKGTVKVTQDITKPTPAYF